MKSSILLLLIFITANLCAAQTAKRTITNDDLEKFKQPRLKAEADYRANYKKLGMPSPEELEKREAERIAWNEEFSRKYTAEKQQTVGFYQAQANQLKAEIVDVQAQINYLRSQIGNVPNQNPIFVSPNQVYGVGVLPYGNFGQNSFSRRNSPPARAIAPAPNGRIAINPPTVARPPYSRMPSYPTGINPIIGRNNPTGRGGRGGYGRPYYYGGYPIPYVANSGSNQREEIISQLRYMEQVKAGFLAQYNLLEEEARRAGVRID